MHSRRSRPALTESNSALELGGLTPSVASLLQAKSRLKIPYVCMIRPRPGGFCYSEAEIEAVQQDASFALEHGAAGIVFGILKNDGTIDVSRCRALVERAAGREIVFHRAFDLVPDPVRALDELIGIGVTRVLTSGQQTTAIAGADLLRKLIEHAGGKIQVLPAGSIRPGNVRELVSRTGCNQVHLAAMENCVDPSFRTSDESRVGFQAEHRRTDGALVARIAEMLRGPSETST